MSSRKFLLILTAVFTNLTSCDFGDTNVDPTRPQDVDLDIILPAAIAQSARNAGSIGARVTGIVIQHFDGNELQTEAYHNYVLDENVIDDYWRTGLYSGAMKDCNLIIQNATEDNAPYFRGIARTLIAYNLGIATSFWGDVPFSEAFAGHASLNSRYESQEEIYQTIQQLLSSALVDFAQLPSDIIPGSNDLIFGGNISKWIATARSLKARYYLHLSSVDANAALQALTELSKGSISSNNGQPDFHFESSSNGANPMGFFADDRNDQMGLGNFLNSLMSTLNDPRRSMYPFVPGNFWTRFESPLPLISYSEVEFIKAEAYLRIGDEDKASEALRAAIVANMDYLGIASTAYQTYVNANSTLNTLPDFESKLQRIIEQKYIAMYGQSSIESWVDYRRTGYPVLSPPANANASFFSQGTAIIPRRYLYPQSERSTNNASYLEAIDRQGGHELDVDMWAFPRN